MEESKNDRDQQQRKLPSRRGCLVSLSFLFLIPIICFAGIWLFAHLGGDIATSNDIPIPPASQLIAVNYESEDWYYHGKTSLYIHEDSPEELLQWYRTQDIWLAPVSDSETQQEPMYSSLWGFHRYSTAQELHKLSAWLFGWFDEFVPQCQHIGVYSSFSDIDEEFNIDGVPNVETLFTIRTCWANVDYQ